MDSQQFREFGREAIDFLANYYDTIRDRDVLPSVQPGDIIKKLPKDAPEQPEPWQQIFQDFKDVVIPGITNWNSPQFHAYYPAGYSLPSVIGGLLGDGLGVLGLTWIASPACTELEVVAMDWLAKLLGLPDEFLNSHSGPGGGVLQGSASEAMLVGLLAAKDKMVRRLKKQDPDLDEDLAKTKFVAYTSDHCNSAVEKAGVLGSMKMRLLESDINGRLRGKTLKKAMEEDKALGLIPCYVVCNLGTTGLCSFDAMDEIGPICRENNVWLHVDAAYAGSALICQEYRHLLNGIEYADSFDVNAHKWFLVNFDCSAMWVRDSYDLINAFDVQRVYLEDVDSEIKIPDYRHWQMPLGRRFRALKLWFVMKSYGAEGIRSYIRRHISLAQYFAKLMKADNRFIIEPEPSMGLVCFRLVQGDLLTKKLLENITKKKKLFMVRGSFRNQYIIRIVICSQLTNIEDVELSWNKIKNEANTLLENDAVHIKSQTITTIHGMENICVTEKSK
ncbi:aromatic-L-amino-acid decarboxylase-like isoform X4 [Leptidea sinapis]|uniref:aromatic-L-amino-acid decarboxylase-like isoform X4 n=1 Tax=Leptidea sinapis TaxID=189913 RepID=UPI0021C30D05|nr:aromatic-L-amino-acid decarboxylase-like isoform X4 [Leptidea sinapis]